MNKKKKKKKSKKITLKWVLDGWEWILVNSNGKELLRVSVASP